MRNKIIVAVILGCMLTLCGCGDKNKAPLSSYPYGAITDNFLWIQDNLYYDKQTNVVYWIATTSSGYHGYGFMTPYYAPNGLPYRYEPITKKLYEIPYPTVEDYYEA